jgi:predicted nucleotidyltransferase
MDRDQVISVLKRHERELRALGVERVVLFGSTARDTALPSSDVDIAVRLAPGPVGFDRLALLSRIEARLSELFGRRVDVVEEPARSPYIRDAIERDGLRAF